MNAATSCSIDEEEQEEQLSLTNDHDGEEGDGLVVVVQGDQKNRDYSRVAGFEGYDDANLDPLHDANLTVGVTSTSSTPISTTRIESLWWQTVLHSTILPDDKFHLLGIRFADGPFAIKLFKFVAVTFAGICSMFWFVRWMQWENDSRYTLHNMYVYESILIVQDCVVYFVVGRLHQQRGVDHLAWLGWSLLANLYSSWITDFKFLQHSSTLYEMHCRWPLKLWIFCAFAAVIVIIVAVMHIRRAITKGVFVMKLTEITVCLFLLMAPCLTSPYFHLHHWYAGFVFGMHFNFDVWWSRAVLAWCWGCYINGIAVYGRDPVLTCGYAYFLSVDQRCPYVSCYLQALAHPTYHNDTSNHTVVDVKPMVRPDWRNCSADAFHP